MSQMARVAVSSDFLGAFAKLPQSTQNKVSKFLTNFQRNPMAPGINYERIRDARDPNMRSVRIDDAWRGIVLKPEQGNVFLLLWVDRHDDAYAWAARHRCAINAATGAIQVFETVHVEEAAASHAETAPPATPGLFDHLSDRDIALLGAPMELLTSIRAIKTDTDLDLMQTQLPAEAYEGLFLVSAGDTVEKVLNERQTRVDQTVDTEDFGTALATLESQARFVVVENETELAAVLNASMAQWRVFLHPSQRRLVQGRKGGPVRVLGGAGTGKTVVAMHRAKWLAENWLPEHQKILFTTFTRNLAVDIAANLRQLCSPETLSRIEVINLDAWVRRFLQHQSYEFAICYGSDEALWGRAMAVKPTDVALADGFYREEWQRVIQPQGIEALDAYLRASRVGRGTTLGRADRARIWPVFEEYRSQMARARKKEVDDAYRDAAGLLEAGKITLPYAAVVVDEGQDMGPQAFRLLRSVVARGENDLFIVGDAHQRIYGRNKVVLSKSGIDIRGRSRKLRVNYRTTEEIRRTAVALLQGQKVDDLDGGLDEQRGYRSLTHGQAPSVLCCESAEAQATTIGTLVNRERGSGASLASICVVARTNHEVDAIESALKRLSIKCHRIKTDEADSGAEDAVRTATMHRVKGLEFDHVLVASVNAGLVPLDVVMDTTDPVERATAELEERSLLYVALTRARKTATILSYGEASPFLEGMKRE